MSITSGASITGKLPSLHYAIHHPHVFVLCPHALSFALIPSSFALERPMLVAPHHLSRPFDGHCGHPTRVPRGRGASWNTRHGGREEHVGDVRRRGRCVWWHGWVGGWTMCEQGDGGWHGMDGWEGDMRRRARWHGGSDFTRHSASPSIHTLPVSMHVLSIHAMSQPVACPMLHPVATSSVHAVPHIL